jgi:prepilin-type N-terminal cleavage/methylation domain-containing protein
MRQRRRTNSTPSHSGYTLVELLLAMAVLVAIAGIAWPVMQGQFQRYLLKNEVETVRAKLASTRIRAIDSGLIYQFLYEPGGRHFIVVPFEGVETEAEQVDAGGGSLYRITGSLSENWMFETPEDASMAAEDLSDLGVLSEDFLMGLPGSLELSSVSWSQPILFYPDGTAVSAAFNVVDTKKQFVRISVRELTGAVSVDAIRQETR